MAVVADFNGGRLTTDAGTLLLRDLGQTLGLFDAICWSLECCRAIVSTAQDTSGTSRKQ